MEFNSRNPDLAPLIGKTSENWSNYDNAMLQRVPFMVVMPGYEKDKSSIPTVDKSISYRLSNTSLVLSPIPSFKLVKTFCLQIIKKSLPFELPIPSSHQNILAYDGRTYYTESGLEISNLDEQAQTELEIVRQAASQQLKPAIGFKLVI